MDNKRTSSLVFHKYREATEKDTCGQSYTTAWRAMHSPALSGFLWQNLDHPKNEQENRCLVAEKGLKLGVCIGRRGSFFTNQ